MAEDLVSIGIAYDTSQLTTGARQVQTALQQLTQAERQTQTASEQLTSSSTKTAQAIGQETQAARQATSALTQTASATSRTAQATAQLGQQASTASGALATMAQQAIAFGAGQAGILGVAAAFGKVKDALSGAAQSAMQLESMTASFKAISGSSQAAEKDLAFLRQTATRLGVDFTSLAKGYTTLSASAQNTTLSGAAVRDIFTAIAEKGRVLGKSAEDINGAMLAVGQSISKGTIQAEELRGQLSERLPGAFNDMARAMGVSTAELNKMLEAGNVGIENWKAWAAVVRSDLGSATQEAAQTASAALARLGNATSDLSTTIGKALLPALTATVTWLTNVVTTANDAIKALNSFDEARRKSMKEAETLAGGPGVQAGAQAELVAAQDEVRKARAERQALERVGGGLLGGTEARIEQARQRELAALAKEIELKRQLESVNKRVKESDPLGEGPGIEPGAVDEKRVAFQAQLTEQVKKNRQELEQLNTVSQQLYGRKATEDEILKLREKQDEATVKLINSNQQLWNLYKDTGPAKELRAQAAGSEALKKSMEDAEKAERDRKAAKTKADHEAEAARKKKEQEDEAAAQKEIQRFKEIGDAEDRKFEQLTRLAAQYSTLKAARDEDTASTLAAELATSQYAERSKELLEVIQAVQQTEAKLPALRADAARSAGTLTDLQRLEKQLEPQRRGMSRAEQLAATRADIARLPMDEQSRVEALARADEKIKEALDTERWQEWSDFATESIDRVGDAITQFAFHGKLTFKDMVDSIAEDFFRMSLRMLTESAFSSAGGGGKGGGWLDLALKAGKSLLGIAGGVSGGGGGRFAGGDAPGMQHGGTALAGMPYWVGEAGPELVVPKQTSTVIPHQQSMAMPAPTINFYIQGVTNPNEWRPSQGAIQRTVASGVSQAYRGL